MQYGRVLTYKDIEEAEKLIGKKVIASDFLVNIEKGSQHFTPMLLIGVHAEDLHPFRVDAQFSAKSYQFICEVIEDEPQYRPYDSPTELVQDYLERFKCKDIPKQALPLIWVKYMPTDDVLLITGYNFDDEYVLTSEGKMTMSELHAEWTFLDGSPCGAKK